jgi:hypothetical protein
MEIPPNVGISPEEEHVCISGSQIWGDFWPTEYTESMDNMLLMLYPVLELLRTNGGWWGAEMQRIIPPNVGKSPRWERSAPSRVHSQEISGLKNHISMRLLF